MKKYLAIVISIISITFYHANANATENQNPNDFVFNGFIDGSYNYLLRSNQFTSGTNDRVFDLNENGFTLQQATTFFGYQPKEGFGGLATVIIGHDAFETASYGMNPDFFGINAIGLDLTQLFVQYAQGPITLTAGKFITLAGEEIIFPTRDTNFSRSILFGYSTPDTLTGLRAVYVFNDKLNFTLGVNNGWDSIRDTSRQKTIEWAINYTPNPMFSFSLDGLNGEERASQSYTDSGPEGRRNLIDFIATITATDKLSLIANYDYGSQSQADLSNGTLGKATWQGIAGYINYSFTEQWLTSFRAEIFDDENGYRTGVAQVWKELTLTLGYLPIKNLEFRAETRHDFSNTDAFEDKHHNGTNNNQQSFALEGFYKF
jgi:hypothetical protein